MKKNKRCKALLCLFLTLLTVLSSGIQSLPTFAQSDSAAMNWYTKRNKTHTLFEADAPFRELEQYNACYGNKKAAEGGEKVVYLTFDAGYENGNVEKILDTLKKHNAEGAFFILENLILRNPELVRRMASEGHLICNHTATHPDMSRFTSKEEFRIQLDRLTSVLKEKLGLDVSPFYRPPEGRFSFQNLKDAKELGYTTVFWSFAYADWDNNNQMSPDEAFKKITDNVHPGGILLLHPTSSTNAVVLDRVLTYLEGEGYRFGSLNELTVK